MPNCTICGNPTRKGRKEHIGCRAIRKVLRKRDQSSNTEIKLAKRQLNKNPDMIITLLRKEV